MLSDKDKKSQVTLETKIDDLYLIGGKLAPRFRKLNVSNLKDLFFLLPNRYQDRRPVTKLTTEASITLSGQVQTASSFKTQTGLTIQNFKIICLNTLVNVVFYNQPYLLKSLKAGDQLMVWGRLDKSNRGWQLAASGYEIVKPGQSLIHAGKIVAIYPETKGLGNKQIRRIINFYLNKFSHLIPKEYLPATILSQEGYPGLPRAVFNLHRPLSLSQGQLAKQRFLFEQLFLYQLASALKYKQWQTKTSRFQAVLSHGQELIPIITATSQLKPSDSQKRAINQITKDMESKKPMNRLVLGDVGSGKTLVAAAGAYLAYLNQQKTILMTPTDILAQQTYHKFISYLPKKAKISLHTQSHKLKSDNWQILIGTHALLWKQFNNDIGLVIIDEQHRFGVRQRAKLTSYNPAPHILTMSATPIPRTLLLTLFGHLDISYLEPLPDKVKATVTKVVKPHQIQAAYKWIVKQTQTTKQQAFIVAPLIEDSDHETLKDIKAITSLYRQLKSSFPDFTGFGLLHGRMKSTDKDKIIKNFAAGKIRILITTSVIEVGIDIPQVSIILIEGAERFGLAQLHQLRGRVGRLGQKSYCFLVPSKLTAPIFKRLKLVAQTHSGHQLAELDLKLRGPGQIFGLAQHGFPHQLMPLLAQPGLVAKAKNYAKITADQFNRYTDLQDYYYKGKMKDIDLN